ncbi:uncharacterized protein LOC131020632 isoform X2 [Salvia miltiorrhiza]|uniref:uncharacterized protein LOC131020632 isoform X2 n=2 Tax=Salvia miltiorrhiza TaxID=226208 RepID=UPI0025AD396C|nr:uncharacterized protein LOC131020632 isoform X2 [Salvia miltiorrhiza]
MLELGCMITKRAFFESSSSYRELKNTDARSWLRSFRFQHPRLMESHRNPAGNPTFVTSARSNTSGGRGKRIETKDNRQRSRGNCSSSSGNDKINALGRLLTRILRHKAAELNLDMRNDGYVKVQDLLKLNLKTMANIPLQSHTVEDIREAVRQDNKQRFSLLEENGELLLRANQGHSIAIVETESLLKPILSPEEVAVCVHGTYKRSLEPILREGLKRMQRLHVHFSSGLPRDAQVVSGMRRDVDMLIFLDVRKALEEGMKLYVSDNGVILTEGFDGVVPVKYFQKIESWPQRRPVPF